MRGITIKTWIILGAIAMVTFCGCSDNNSYVRYESKNPAFNVVFDYLVGWDVAEQAGSHGSFIQAVLYEPEAGNKKIRANMVVAFEPAQLIKVQPPTLEAYAQDLITRRMNFKDARLVLKKAIKCAGQQAIEIVLEYRALDNPKSPDAVYVPVRERISILKKAGAFYTFRYMHDIDGYDSFSKAFERLLASARFKN